MTARPSSSSLVQSASLGVLRAQAQDMLREVRALRAAEASTVKALQAPAARECRAARAQELAREVTALGNLLRAHLQLESGAADAVRARTRNALSCGGLWAAVDVTRFDRVTQSTLAAEECCICLTGFSPGQPLREAPCSSQHVFHEGCAVRWFRDHGTCPLCRADLQQMLRSALRK
mmetsp:Transcript_58411/g.135953  ORF Transcript_58411/g.135953 Transcript_58411/m.135953 type:complete len:177 (+) Transcript_58411:37-567(+)